MDMKLKTVLILVFFAQTSGWRPFTIELRNISYELVRPEIIDFNLTTNQKGFDANITILRDISQPFVNFVVLHDSGDGKYDMVYVNKTVDICMFLNNRKSNILMDVIYKILSDYADLPKHCPVRRKRYEFYNVIIDPDKVPPFIPDHTAKFLAEGWNKINGKKTVFLKMKLYIAIERSFKNSGKG